MKYGATKDLEPELATQEYPFHHAQKPQTPEPPRIAEIVHHFVHQKTMYLVMETYRASGISSRPRKEDTRSCGMAVQHSTTFQPQAGPRRGQPHTPQIFKDSKAPFDFSDPAMLDLYTMKVRPWFVSLAFTTANMSSGPGVRLALGRSLEEGVSCQC